MRQAQYKNVIMKTLPIRARKILIPINQVKNQKLIINEKRFLVDQVKTKMLIL
jgi:hypothetical protein